MRHGSLALIRNPILTWMCTVSLGVALAVGTPAAWLGMLLVLGGVEAQVRLVE